MKGCAPILVAMTMLTRFQPQYRKLLVAFGSLRLAIALLLLVALASTIGTVLPQDEGAAAITNSTFSPLVKRLLFAIHADDVYHCLWFQSLLGLLFINLAACTKLRFPATWRRYFTVTPVMPGVGAMQVKQRLSSAPDDALLARLRAQGYRVRALEGGNYFAERCKFARLGPTFVHLALFVVIGGAIWGGLTSWRGDRPVTTGTSVSSDELFKGSTQGRFASAPAPFDLTLDSFRMDTRPNGQVKQYYSELTVTPKDGTKPHQERIWVNQPLVYGGVYVYQSTWGIATVTCTVGGHTVELPLKQTKVGYFSRQLPLHGEPHVLFVKSLDEPALLVSTQNFAVHGRLVPGTATMIDRQLIELVQYRLFSGFQVKRDPGIPGVYLGSALLLLGLGLVPIAHRELWIRRDDQGWVLGGRASKGRVALGEELARLVAAWQGGVAPLEGEIAS
jgi:cytochrome c biogenesis protein